MNELSLPRNLMLEINHKCNYHCPWCYCVWHEDPVQKMRNLSMADWRKIIAASIERGVTGFQFSGGEATLREGWQELLCFTRRMLPDGDLSLFTNGSRLTEQDLRLCRKNRVRICISLQGLRTYSAMTGTGRSYRKTLELLMRAKELHCPCSVSITATRQNLPEMEDIYTAAAISGAATVQINALMFAGRAQDRTDLAVAPEAWRDLKARMQKCHSGPPIFFGEEIICRCEHPGGEKAEWELTDAFPCAAGQDFGVFGPDGYFRKCLHTTEKLFYWKQLFEKEIVL